MFRRTRYLGGFLNWYLCRYANHGSAYGLILDTRHTDWTKSDWQIWTSAIVTSTSVRDLFIDGVAKWAADGQTTAPLSDWCKYRLMCRATFCDQRCLTSR